MVVVARQRRAGRKKRFRERHHALIQEPVGDVGVWVDRADAGRLLDYGGRVEDVVVQRKSREYGGVRPYPRRQRQRIVVVVRLLRRPGRPFVLHS